MADSRPSPGPAMTPSVEIWPPAEPASESTETPEPAEETAGDDTPEEPEPEDPPATDDPPTEPEPSAEEQALQRAEELRQTAEAAAAERTAAETRVTKHRSAPEPGTR